MGKEPEEEEECEMDTNIEQIFKKVIELINQLSFNALKEVNTELINLYWKRLKNI